MSDNGKALKPLSEGEMRDLFGSLIEGVPKSDKLSPEAVRSHLGCKAATHRALELMLGMLPGQAIAYLSPPPQVIATRIDPQETLMAQVDHLMRNHADEEAKVGFREYRDQLVKAVDEFVWRPELAAIGLKEVALVDYRLSKQFLARISGVEWSLDPDKYTADIAESPTPNGALVIQAQWGEKYLGKASGWCLSHFDPLEQGGTVKEGLTALVYRGKQLLKKNAMDLPGSVAPGTVPCISLGFDNSEPSLDRRFPSDTHPQYGSVSRGRC